MSDHDRGHVDEAVPRIHNTRTVVHVKVLLSEHDIYVSTLSTNGFRKHHLECQPSTIRTDDFRSHLLLFNNVQEHKAKTKSKVGKLTQYTNS